MKKNLRLIAIASLLALSFFMSACGGSETNANNSNRANANRPAS
ncbi:MAG TPA: hypothetical protein VIG62_09695 [Blastocatellia bacterium]